MGMEIIFADVNEEYLERLTHYVKEHFEDKYTISICLDKEQLQARLKAGKYDVLCFAPELYDGKMDFKQVLVPIILLDEEEEVPYPDKFKYTINKYTRISKLLQYIDEVYEIARKNRPLVYGVYGPAGGVGSSTTAIATALSYAAAGRKTCYLNLEDISSTGLFFEERNSEVLSGKTQHMMRRDIKSGVLYCTNVSDALNQTRSSITGFIEGIIDSEIATVIVIDLGSSLSAIHREVFACIDKLLVVTMDTNCAAYKLEAFMNGVLVDQEKIEIVYNQSNTISSQVQVPVAGRIDKLYAKQAIGICEYIAQNHLIKVAGI